MRPSPMSIAMPSHSSSRPRHAGTQETSPSRSRRAAPVEPWLRRPADIGYGSSCLVHRPPWIALPQTSHCQRRRLALVVAVPAPLFADACSGRRHRGRRRRATLRRTHAPGKIDRLQRVRAPNRHRVPHERRTLRLLAVRLGPGQGTARRRRCHGLGRVSTVPSVLRRRRSFERNGKTETHRVLVTDGGVFENLGVSVMEPGRDAEISAIGYNPDVIIASDAGAGQFTGESVPVSWPKRMTQVVSAVIRKVQDATKQRLHDHAKAGRIDGFVYAALGQIDRRVPLKPANWVNPRRGRSLSDRLLRDVGNQHSPAFRTRRSDHPRVGDPVSADRVSHSSGRQWRRSKPDLSGTTGHNGLDQPIPRATRNVDQNSTARSTTSLNETFWPWRRTISRHDV